MADTHALPGPHPRCIALLSSLCSLVSISCSLLLCLDLTDAALLSATHTLVLSYCAPTITLYVQVMKSVPCHPQLAQMEPYPPPQHPSFS